MKPRLRLEIPEGKSMPDSRKAIGDPTGGAWSSRPEGITRSGLSGPALAEPGRCQELSHLPVRALQRLDRAIEIEIGFAD